MNTINNKRKRNTKDKIEKVFVELLQKKDINEVSVTDICKLVKINRTTFYNNYIDIYDLAEQIKNKLEQDVYNLYEDERVNKYNSNDFSKIFKLVKENPLFFKTYFKLEGDSNIFHFDQEHLYDTDLSKKYYNDEYIDYHIEFFKAGFNAILKKWLDNGCKESVDEMCKILESEYSIKTKETDTKSIT